jgi:hypothetical protein
VREVAPSSRMLQPPWQEGLQQFHPVFPGVRDKFSTSPAIQLSILYIYEGMYSQSSVFAGILLCVIHIC